MTTTTLPTTDLQTLFDVAIHSMDFGSGFLDDEEVETLRRIATLLGVDPDKATPAKHLCRYAGHKPEFCANAFNSTGGWICARCRVDVAKPA